MTDPTTERPVPMADELSAPYWAAARRHEPVLPRCSACGQLDLPAGVACRRCGSPAPQWRYEPVSGGGTIRSWTVVRQSFLPGFETPFVLVDVEVDEQADLRVIGRLLDSSEPSALTGRRVDTVFEDIDDAHAVPAFTLAADR